MNLGSLGTALAMGIAAIGSALGIGIAGQASIGAWKKCYMSNKAAPFILTVFAGAPLTQTIYGFLLMQQMKSSTADPAFLLGLGIASGLAMAFSAFVQGKAGAAGADALAQTNYFQPKATMLKTRANRATVSQRPTTVIYWEKPLPVSAKASAPAAPALP